MSCLPNANELKRVGFRSVNDKRVESSLKRRVSIVVAVAMLAMFVTSCEALCPSATSTSAEEVVTPPLRRARIVFLGDVMAHTPQLNAARRGNGYDFSAVFSYVKPIFAKADLVVAKVSSSVALNSLKFLTLGKSSLTGKKLRLKGSTLIKFVEAWAWFGNVSISLRI